jgi:16S rRNA processing protein RimM
MRGLDPAVPPGQPDHHTGSPPGMGEPVFLAVGRLRKAHGVRGEISMEVLTDFPERLRARKLVYVGDGHLPMQITRSRWKSRLLLLSFEGYHDCDQVNLLRNELVYVHINDLAPLPEGHYYHHQLLGMAVRDEAGNFLGTLAEILETGANDVYVVRAEGKEDLLLPAIEGVIIQVDLADKVVVVHPPEWE